MANTNCKKYVVTYCSATTGYGWKQEFDRLSEFEPFIDEMRNVPSAAVDVYDRELGDFIFNKDCFCEPDVDMLRGLWRDMRTKNRKMKM